MSIHSSEDNLLDKLDSFFPFSSEIIAGVGEDCAVIKTDNSPLFSLYKVDTVVEMVHYEPEEDPKNVGRKAVARVLSDFAAMSGKLSYILLSLGIKKNSSFESINRIYLGMNEILSDCSAKIIGGDTTYILENTSPFISVTGIGEVEKDRLTLRSGGKIGDSIWVTGNLGRSLPSKKHLFFSPRWKESRWLTKNFSIHSMMDLSDGLVADLPRIGKKSECGFILDYSKIPCSMGSSVEEALTNGEDYELLFSLPPDEGEKLSLLWKKKFPEVLLTQIGFFCPFEKGESFPSEEFD